MVTATLARGLTAHLERLDELHVFPAAASKVLEVARRPDSSLADMERAVARDPVLVGRVLKLANSPMYGRPTRVSSVERAIAALGFAGTRDIALALAIGGVGSNKSPWGKRLWTHALGGAWAAKLMSRHVRQADSEAAFVAGLLRDVGLQLLLVLHEKEANEMFEARTCVATGSRDDERRLFGCDHAELGGAALRRWSLPEAVCEAVEVHHQPLGATRTARPRDVALLQVADAMALAAADTGSVDAVVLAGMQHPSAAVLRAVRGAYIAVSETLLTHWDSLVEF